MKLIANGVNGNYLRDFLPDENDGADSAVAAIAYGSDIANRKEDLIGNCLKLGLRLDIWMRYDQTVPVSVSVLERLLVNKRNNIFCKLIPDCFHPKLIWWPGYGCYIGSANLTDRAWNSNIEAGLFLTADDLERDGISIQLELFFNRLRELPQSYPLTDELIQEMREFVERRTEVKNDPESRLHPFFNGLNFASSEETSTRDRDRFLRERNATLQVMRHIAEELVQARPNWVRPETPLPWEVDQFLHSYYTNRVGDRRQKPIEEYYERNRMDPYGALSDAITWWRSTAAAPSNENETFDTTAPYIRDHLSSAKLPILSVDEFSNICLYTHATKDHVAKIALSKLGRPDLKNLSISKRVPLFAAWLWSERNAKGWGIQKLLEFVLYGGEDTKLLERLYLAANSDEYALPHYGINSLAEVVGWARPDIAWPRNGRTNKALRALGYDVRVD